MPKFYLKRFADSDGQFVRVPIKDGGARTIGVNDATVHKDFYSFRGPDGQLDDMSEEALADMERVEAKVFRRVVEEGYWPLRGVDREYMAYWVATQHLRVPAKRQAANEMADHIVKIMAAVSGKPHLRQRMEEEAGGPVSEEEVDRAWGQVIDFDGYAVEPDSVHHLDMMWGLIPQVAQLLMQRTWVLARFTRKTLITSDHPVVLVRSESAPPWMGQGVADAPIMYVPLDRRVGLIMYLANGAPDNVAPPTVALAQEMNQRVAFNARSAVFHHPDDDLRGIRLPDPRPHEVQINQGPESFLLPDGPPEEFKKTMSHDMEPPAGARRLRRMFRPWSHQA
ncbi:DUF4238 domain-containing protein [Streptomyces sp. CH-036]|uniref:DUF4238 domain-containing protein n=1 Tax=Streptomyces sp. CH-036 TaxID=3406733 RepID=UPI003C74A55A